MPSLMQSTLFDLYDTAAFPIAELLAKAVEVMASNNDPESRGAIYTRVEVVDRQEQIPGALLAEYRRRFSTLYDRADLYVPFIERSLSLLATNGALGFICSDRWMKNRYGGPLRNFISQDYQNDVQASLRKEDTGQVVSHH